ncbi:MAG: tetratricopeptide repeat protein, partial [Gammaproteobacteria bacterium]
MVKSGEWLFRGLSLLLAASLLIGCGGKEERKAKYLERGKEYFEAQNFDKARVEFKNVLQIDPKTADAYYYLGEIEEQEQEWRRAFGSYRKASELDPELIAARKKLAQFYLARAAALRAQDDMSGLANALALAQEEVKAVLQRVPDDLEGLTLEAQLWVLEGKTDEAVAQLQRVLAKDPGWNSAVSLLSRIYENLGKLQESERVMTAGIAASQRPKSLRVELAQLYVRQKQYDKAEGVLRTLIENDPEQLSYRISLASLFSRTEQPNKAEKVLREAIEAAPEDAQRYGLLVDFIARERSAEAAIRELEGFIQRNPDMSELRFGMVRLRLDNNEAGAAKRALEEIIAREGLEPNGLRARTILAQVLAAENEESPRIGILLDEVLKENPRDNDALLLMAKLDAKKGRYDEAIANFRSVLKDKPESSEVLQLLATAHLANGDRELARDTMSRAVQVNPGDNDLRLSLVKLLVQDGKADEALEQTNEVLKRDEYHETALAMKYELLGRKGDVAGMEEVAKLMQTGAPEKEEGYIREARLRLAQRDFDAAL